MSHMKSAKWKLISYCDLDLRKKGNLVLAHPLYDKFNNSQRTITYTNDMQMQCHFDYGTIAPFHSV